MRGHVIYSDLRPSADGACKNNIFRSLSQHGSMLRVFLVRQLHVAD